MVLENSMTAERRRAWVLYRILLPFLLLVVGTAPGWSSAFYGHTILALYKSSDGQGPRANEIYYYLSNDLTKMGFHVRYWDIDSGLPRATEMEDVRAIVTWFRSSSMNDPLAYLKFLNASIDEGRKLIVFENFGAYQNRATGEYVQPGLLNPTLERLGLIYLGDWTDKGNLLRIVSIDKSIAEHGGPQDPGISKFYYRFIPTDRDLHVYLSLRRTDQDHRPSPVIVTNRNGGFALSRYIYRVEDGKVRILLDLDGFVKNALFPSATRENVGLLADTKDRESSRVLSFTRAVLSRDRIPTTVIPSTSFSGLIPGDLRKFTAVGLIVPTDAGIDPAVIKSFLQEGGGLVSLERGNFTRIHEELAMGSAGASPPPQTGYLIPAGFLLGEGVSVTDPTMKWQPGNRPPASDAKILATSLDGRVALMWSADRYGGKVIVWNWASLDSGDYQGAIVESFLAVRPVGVAATAGVAMMYIDDFPQPMYNIVKPPLHITDTEFYSTIWWPQIRELFASRGIPFSAYTVFNYNAEVTPPFQTGEFYVAKDGVNEKMAREILRSSNELGLHGYNHASLTMKPTSVNARPWPSVSAMVTALSEGRREWTGLYGADTLPFSYVAPNNIISSAGVEALHEAFPTIHVVAALRAGDNEETDTPFGPDQSIPGIYFIPRNSWGYIFNGGAKMRVVSALSGPGIWTHFIHPDDVFDPIRSEGLSWEQLRSNFVDMLSFVKENYPWVRYLTVRDGYNSLQVMDSRQASFRWDGSSMHIRSTPGLLVRVRSNIGRIKSMSGVEVVYQYKRMDETILRTTAEDAVLRF